VKIARTSCDSSLATKEEVVEYLMGEVEGVIDARLSDPLEVGQEEFRDPWGRTSTSGSIVSYQKFGRLRPLYRPCPAPWTL
jgi:hypothetical protein